MPGKDCFRVEVQVDVLALIQRYSTENGVQLNRGQPSLMDLGQRPEVNWDPVTVMLIAHFFDKIPKDELDKMSPDQQQAAKMLQNLTKQLTRPEMKDQMIKVSEHQAQGKSTLFVLDAKLVQQIPEPDAAMLKAAEHDPNIARALKILQAAKAENRGLKQDELAAVMAILGSSLPYNAQMWEKASQQMIKQGVITIDDQKVLMARIVKANNYDELTKRLEGDLKCMGGNTAHPGQLTLTKDAKLSAHSKAISKGLTGKESFFRNIPGLKRDFVERGHASKFAGGAGRSKMVYR